MSASPTPMTRCQLTIAVSTVPRSSGAVPPTAKSRLNAAAATGTLTSAATAAAGPTEAEPLGQHRAGGDEHQPADADPDQGHQRDVGADRGDPAVGHEQRLDEQHHADAEHRGPRSDQDGGQRPAEEVAAGAGRDREVHHLPGEHERRDEARHGGGTVVEFLACPAQGHGDADRGDRAGGQRRGRVEESVRYVHVAQSTLLHIGCNCAIGEDPTRDRHGSPPETPPPTSPSPPTPARRSPCRRCAAAR